MYHDGQRVGTKRERRMWQRNRLFPPRGPIVIYAPENDPLPTWNIKNHARTWKFRKKDDGDDGNGDSEKDLAQFCTSPPETQRSQSRRWPCRSVSGGRSQLQFSCQLNLWRKRRENERKRSNNLLCRSFWFTTTVSALLPLSLLPFPSVQPLISSLVQRERQSQFGPIEGRTSQTALGYLWQWTREPQPSSALPPCPCSTPLPLEWLAC